MALKVMYLPPLLDKPRATRALVITTTLMVH